MKILGFTTWLSLGLVAFGWEKHFTFETVEMPQGVDSQIGALEQMPDGRMAVAFHRGEVMFYDTKSGSWSLFASGLQEPLGMLAEPDGSMLVMQRAELTRLKDNDGDGQADEYSTVCDEFGISGNYHEFAYGPVRDKDGNYYIALGLASSGAPMAKEIRGTFSEIGKLGREAMSDKVKWNANKKDAGRMYARVDLRGWVLKIAPDGKMQPYAGGFRSPNGMGFDAEGRLLVTDNQGDWRPTSPLYEVRKGGFYGHPTSLVWKDGWDGKDPNFMETAELDAMQVPAIGYFPQGELANSPTQPISLPTRGFPKGMQLQTVIGEMNQPNLIRVLGDEVGGVYQTALVPMFDQSPIGIGNNRIAFGLDGEMYVGKTALSWPGSNGITRIKWKGTEFLFLDEVNALKNGFQLQFSQPLDSSSINTVSIKSHTYTYSSEYGSEKNGEQTHVIKTTKLSADGLSLHLECDALREKHLHTIDMTGLRDRAGEAILGGMAYYQVIKAPR